MAMSRKRKAYLAIIITIIWLFASIVRKINNRSGPPDPIQQFNYTEVFSQTTTNRKFVPISFAGSHAYNTNTIPHPIKNNTWIVVAQGLKEESQLFPSEEVVCEAKFLNGTLVCTNKPTTVNLQCYTEGNCEGKLHMMGLILGPRDARVFMGPDRPYVTYGSQSTYICFGQWVQDARMVLNSYDKQTYSPLPDLFIAPTELKRPGDLKSMVEKNYFLFWDTDGVMYAHYDIWPQRSFAQLELDGSGMSDLAPVTREHDQLCMSKYFPKLISKTESIHQATNSLAITLCNRTDPNCIPNNTNTFIMHIFQHKSYHSYHGMYEPFVILMQRTVPFAIHAISQRPFWIHGREQLTPMSDSPLYHDNPDGIPEGHSEMFYVTSMNWKSNLQNYHGYLDDVLFIGFGIEDARPGLIDVLAGDLLQDLAFC